MGRPSTKETDDEAEQIYRRADYFDFSRTGHGAVTADVCQRHGISQTTFSKWKTKFGGMDFSALSYGIGVTLHS
jgi:hypothetical protein